jgi:hypothetical protein
MDISEVRVGQRVVARNHYPGTVVHVGTCYWPGCRYGADCVEVRPDNSTAGNQNYRADVLQPEQVDQ